MSFAVNLGGADASAASYITQGVAMPSAMSAVADVVSKAAPALVEMKEKKDLADIRRDAHKLQTDYETGSGEYALNDADKALMTTLKESAGNLQNMLPGRALDVKLDRMYREHANKHPHLADEIRSAISAATGKDPVGGVQRFIDEYNRAQGQAARAEDPDGWRVYEGYSKTLPPHAQSLFLTQVQNRIAEGQSRTDASMSVFQEKYFQSVIENERTSYLLQSHKTDLENAKKARDVKAQEKAEQAIWGDLQKLDIRNGMNQLLGDKFEFTGDYKDFLTSKEIKPEDIRSFAETLQANLGEFRANYKRLGAQATPEQQAILEANIQLYEDIAEFARKQASGETIDFEAMKNGLERAEILIKMHDANSYANFAERFPVAASMLSISNQSKHPLPPEVLSLASNNIAVYQRKMAEGDLLGAQKSQEEMAFSVMSTLYASGGMSATDLIPEANTVFKQIMSKEDSHLSMNALFDTVGQLGKQAPEFFKQLDPASTQKFLDDSQAIVETAFDSTVKSGVAGKLNKHSDRYELKISNGELRVISKESGRAIQSPEKFFNDKDISSFIKQLRTTYSKVLPAIDAAQGTTYSVSGWDTVLTGKLNTVLNMSRSKK